MQFNRHRPFSRNTCRTLSPFVIGTDCLMCFPIHLPIPAVCVQCCIMDHFSCVSDIHFPDFRYEILEVCLDHIGAYVFPGSH